MKTAFTKHKKGFTIIEVSLVLAIGGLIMLMVFIAWPAIQRNQHDSQRRSVDFSRLYTALTNYQTNNKGKLPTTTANVIVNGDTIKTTEYAKGTWGKFYQNYLDNNEGFYDPLGTPYSLSVTLCSNEGNENSPNKDLTANTPCTGKAKSAVSSNELLSDGEITAKFDDQEATIVVVVGAKCDGETAVAATNKTGGTRQFAIMYKLEAGGVHCQS